MRETKSKSKKIAIAVVSVIIALVMLALAFLGGYLTRGAVGGTTYDWVLGVIQQHYYRDVDMDNADEIAIDALVKEYLDIYSEYYTAEEYAAAQNSNAGSKSGLGISYSYIPGTGLVVVKSSGNSPSFRAGLRAGDVILYGESGGERTYFNSAADFSSFVTSLEAGENAAYFCASGESFTFAKEEYAESYVMLATNSGAWTFTGADAKTMSVSEGDEIEYLPDGAAYINLSQFYGKAVYQFCHAVEKINELGCTSLIIDLRNNGGGYVSVMQGISGCFEQSAGKLAMEARSEKCEPGYYEAETFSDEYTLSEETDVYVLANGNTASASEALIGVLISYGIADYGDIYISEYSDEYLSAAGVTAEEVKSGRTYGKGIMQSTYRNLNTGEALKLTTHEIFWPNGVSIHNAGLSFDDGCNTVYAPMPLGWEGEELQLAVQQIYGLN